LVHDGSHVERDRMENVEQMQRPLALNDRPPTRDEVLARAGVRIADYRVSPSRYTARERPTWLAALRRLFR
jgi:hypothetical protein